MPICRQNTTLYIIYELDDVELWEHLISNSKPSCISSYLRKEDVMLVKAIEWTRQKTTFTIAVVRVWQFKDIFFMSKEIFQRWWRYFTVFFVGDVELETVQVVGWLDEDRLQKFKGSNSKCTKSWHYLVKFFTQFKVIQTLCSESCEWISQEMEGIWCTMNL